MFEGEKKKDWTLEVIAVIALCLFLWWKYRKKSFVSSQPQPEPQQKEVNPNPLLDPYRDALMVCDEIIEKPLAPFDIQQGGYLNIPKGTCFRGDGSKYADAPNGYGSAYAEQQAEEYSAAKQQETILNVNKKSVLFRLINSTAVKAPVQILDTTQQLAPFNPTPIPVIDIVIDGDGNEYHYVTIGTQQWLVENLKTTKYADGTPIPNLAINDYNDWVLPSKNALNLMRIELYDHSVGSFSDSQYWSSSEFSATQAWYSDFPLGNNNQSDKSNTHNVRACRIFTAEVNLYRIRDVGPAGGLIFLVNGGTEYWEAAPSDQSINTAWSNIADQLIGTTHTDAGESQNNTNEIIAQVGHTASAAKLCNDLSIGGWINDTIGAYCYYNNDISNKADYGALYNWYAVDNAHGLAPTGWRVPSDADWATLVEYLGGDTVAGGKLKEVGLTHWNTPNGGATDEYGFKAIPAGARAIDGIFNGQLISNWITTSTESSISSNKYVYLVYYLETIVQSTLYKNIGQSVRCMRNV